jgi:hypothetical protein
MRIVLAVAILVVCSPSCLADDLPPRFIGVWMLEDTMNPGHIETCKRSDYNPGYQTNDRVVLIDRKGLTPMEGECRIVAVKDGTPPYPAQPRLTDPVTVRLTSAAEGQEKASPATAVWAIHSIAGENIMVQVDVKEPTKINVYQKCP